MSSKVKVVVNPWLPIIATSNGNTSWYLHATPSAAQPPWRWVPARIRRAADLHEDPERSGCRGWRRRCYGRDFDTDSIQYKVRHVLGGTLLDPKLSVASNGTGS
jgi:hypothetical protein